VTDRRHQLADRVRLRLTLREQTRDIRPRDAAYLIVAVWLVAVVVWGTVEHIIDEKTFPTVWLGMWWALQTVTTVGYGDIVPVQTAGRMVATLLLLGGLAFISVVTASITTGFVARRERQLQESGEDPVLQRLDAIAVRLDGLERDIAALRAPITGGASASEDPPRDA
jgi:voltage-gated potassium channel